MADIDYTAAAKQLHETLDALQFGASPDTGRFFLVEEEPLAPAALTTRRLLVLQLGYILGRTVVLKPPIELNYTEFYQPVGNVTHRDIETSTLRAASFDVEQFDHVVRFDFPAFWANERLRRYFYPWTPAEFSSLKCPRLCFDGEFLSRLVLAQPLSDLTDQTKSRVGFDAPTIGLHAGGGSGQTESPDAPLDTLIEQTRLLAQQAGIDRVLVTGEEHEVVSRQLTDAGLNALTLPSDLDVSVRDIVEIELLSACDWVVGRTTADAPRIAAARIGQRTLRCDRHRLVDAQPERSGLRRVFAK